MNDPDIQYFHDDGTWTKPDGAVAVDVLVVAGGGGGSLNADGQPGEARTMRFEAPDLPSEIDIQIGRGGRGADGGQDGRDGCTVVVTHLEGGDGAAPDWVRLVTDEWGSSSSLPATVPGGGNGGSTIATPGANASTLGGAGRAAHG